MPDPAPPPRCPRCGYLLPDCACVAGVESELEWALADLASYHLARFLSAVLRTNASPAEMAHALWLLGQYAQRQRAALLTSGNEPVSGQHHDPLFTTPESSPPQLLKTRC